MATSPTVSSPNGKKLVKTKSGLRMINIIEDERSPFEIEEPIWKPDSDQMICDKCGVRFSFTTRKHHCRRCGKIFCGSCCTAKVSLPRLSFVDPQRVCTDCINVSKSESELFNNVLPILCKGAEFHLNDQTDVVSCKLEAKLNRNLIFTTSNKVEMQETVYLKDITTFQCLTDPLQTDKNGKGKLVGVNMKYIADNTTRELKMQVSNEIRNQKESLTFLIMLQKAMKMIFDAS
ncbi:zinc finger FYVE domain-containing protein 21-like [Clytia hemisphaerica]|uniref:FYVE-type domain-containing protein n=1 Tax=Clytia hemisphaerica TaxID=252671 RepID=A0A7M5WYY9_9CNID